MSGQTSKEGKVQLSFTQGRQLADDVFQANGCPPAIAATLADVIILCERDGPASHGFFSMSNYMFGLRGGHVNAASEPTMERASAGVIRVDGDNGYGQIAIRRFRDDLITAAREAGIATL
ncbi:MAG: Ldh family oxidoreductase, partial [Alphaproteobacteria bacterium]|nr:Ldh family oxidoreductase [Alphaproteobacteria bacterium]